jgi:hypothetical protein
MTVDNFFCYTKTELNTALLEQERRRKVYDVVCKNTGRRWPMTQWTYATGEVAIESVSIRERSQWENDYISRSVMRVKRRSIETGSSSEMACYDLVKALIPTGITRAEVGSLDLGNQQSVLLMLRELVDAHLLSDKVEREQAIANTQASLLADYINWGYEFQGVSTMEVSE